VSVVTRSVRLPLSDEVRTRWRLLEGASSEPSVFRTPDWVEARAEVLGLTTQTTVQLWEEDDRLLAAFALAATRERLHPSLPVSVPVSTNAAAGTGGADHTGWTAADDAHEHVRSWLESTRRTILLRNLDPDLADRLSGDRIVLERVRCPRLNLKQWSGPAPSVSKRIAYYRRRAAREGLTLSRTLPGDVTAEQLITLRQLHKQRFGSRSVLSDSGIAIQEALRSRQQPEVGPVVVGASAGGRTVGLLWGLWFAGVFAYYQTGWLPESSPLNLGTILVDEAICTARDLGATTFDLLRGPEDYKYRLGAEDRVDSTVLLARGLPGTVLRLKARVRSARRWS
jgi:CelD/BcsL family acetyltransferase involved in cellulose biosynthesis